MKMMPTITLSSMLDLDPSSSFCFPFYWTIFLKAVCPYTADQVFTVHCCDVQYNAMVLLQLKEAAIKFGLALVLEQYI